MYRKLYNAELCGLCSYFGIGRDMRSKMLQWA